jgi:hypothetical protein
MVGTAQMRLCPSYDLISGVPVKAVVRPLSGRLSAAAALPIVGIILIRLHLRALTKCEADKSHKTDQGEKRANPTRYHPQFVASLISAHIADSSLSPQ